jgi:putative ABC transport system permease protein
MNSRLSKAVTAPRFYAVLMGSFSAIAILLALVGLYGVISHSVTLRTQEIGIRAALGAQSSDIVKMVVRQGLWMTGVGLVIGLIGAAATTRTLKGLLFGITPGDPMTFIGIATLVVAVGLLACWIPARRAAKVDPMVALRYE